ncbi:hypothetical protein TrCOL_g3256 [Triparma columacea]|uniref:Inositol polyphosphate-related phosphatase domain-containing protein n=1 Tax=Triparma columacea TaxID=722753 RepID=A0A9W7GK43_9STRA|nr:hypothetical protein TrCOL_g3256 [Triparma columacea]
MRLDQLSKVRIKGEAWGGLVEGKIGFPMTYKLDKNKGGRGGKRKGKGGGDRWKGLKYDSSAKRRVPSYTDRVLYKPYKLKKGKEEDARTECLWYDWIDEDTGSDHKPVAGEFVIRNI